MTRAIVIPLYDHTPDEEIEEILEDLKRMGFSNDPKVVEINETS